MKSGNLMLRLKVTGYDPQRRSATSNEPVLQDAINPSRHRDRSAFILFSHNEFQEPKSICCARVPVGVNRSRRYEQAVTGFQSYGLLAFLLPNA